MYLSTAEIVLYFRIEVFGSSDKLYRILNFPIATKRIQKRLCDEE